MLAAWKAIVRAAGLDRPEKAVAAGSAGQGQALDAFDAMSDQQLIAIVEQAARMN